MSEAPNRRCQAVRLHAPNLSIVRRVDPRVALIVVIRAADRIAVVKISIGPNEVFLLTEMVWRNQGIHELGVVIEVIDRSDQDVHLIYQAGGIDITVVTNCPVSTALNALLLATSHNCQTLYIPKVRTEMIDLNPDVFSIT